MSLWDDARNAVTHTVHTVEGGVERGIVAAASWASSTFGGGNTGRIVNSDSEVEAMLAGDSGQWHAGAGTASDLSGQHRELSTKVMAFAGKMESAWTGNASDAAQVRMKKLSDTLNVTSDTLEANSSNVSGVASHFDSTKSKLHPLPKPAPEKGFVDTITPWDTDTEEAVNNYNATAAQNAQAYKSYATSTRAQGMVLNADYGQLGDFDGGDVTLAPSPADGRSTTGRSTTSGRNVSSRADLVAPPPATRSGGQENTSGGRAPDERGTTGHVPPGAGSGSDETNSAGWTPPTPTPGTGTGGELPLGVPGGLTGDQQRSGTNPYAGFGWNQGSGSLPGGGVPGSGSGSGGKMPGDAGRAGGPGSGSRLGGLAEEPVARGGAGSTRAGGRVTNSPGGMAPGAGRGKGEEDTEHQRKYVLDEDQLFGDDDGLRDPETGYRAAPPTIGA